MRALGSRSAPTERALSEPIGENYLPLNRLRFPTGSVRRGIFFYRLRGKGSWAPGGPSQGRRSYSSDFYGL